MEVVHVFNCAEETIFLSIGLMDLYVNTFNGENSKIKKIMHLIGITCLYMASKMEDMEPISINNLINKICYNQYEA